MIFNPLFLSENSGSQIMAPKQTKMSNSKYLFSDIVKVVMNPVGESNELTKTNRGMIGSNIDLSLDNAQKPVQLKLKFLSDIDNEKAKLGLAEILPIEIAQLLIRDETESRDSKAVSYISQEPLTGELQNFVNNLIGPELIESHLNNKSGLLLSLEDSKSAVNLELAQISGNKSNNENIIVQTLVVPEKSKLLSLMGDVQAKNGLFRIDNSQVQNLNTIGQPVQNLSEMSSEAKPTLSVYSFNYGGDRFESLTKSIKNNNELKPGLSLVAKSQVSTDLSAGIKKVPLEKLSFIPSEIKNNESISLPVANSMSKSNSNLMGEGLKLVNNDSVNTQKDFSVSKITIVKKTSDIIKSDNNKTNIKPNGAGLDSQLKRVDFGSQDLRGMNLLNKKSGGNYNATNVTKSFNIQNNSNINNVLSKSERSEVSVQGKLIQELSKAGVEISKPVNSENNITHNKQKIIDQLNLSKNDDSKILEQSMGTKNNKSINTITYQKSSAKIEFAKNISPQESSNVLQNENKSTNLNSSNGISKIESKLNHVNNEKVVNSNTKVNQDSDTKVNVSETNSTKTNIKQEISTNILNTKITENTMNG